MIFLYEITLSAIDIDNFGRLELFLPLLDHFEIRRFLGLKFKVDLTPRPIMKNCRATSAASPIHHYYSLLFTYNKKNLDNVFRNIIGTRHAHLVHCQFVVSIRIQLLLKLLI